MPILPNELKMSRIFDAPRPLVWKVWTDPKHLSQWWGPFGSAHTESEIDFRVGGAFRVMMTSPDGIAFPARGKFLEIIAPERIVYEGETGAPTACGCGMPPQARVSVLFEELKNQTRLHIETRFPDEQALIAANQDGYSTGWTGSLDKMVEYLASLERSDG